VRLYWSLPCLLWAATTVSADEAATGHAWLTRQVAEFNDLRVQLPAAEMARHIVDGSVDISAFAEHVLGNYVDEALADFDEHLDKKELSFYSTVSRDRLIEAMRQRLIDDLAAAATGALTITQAAFDETHGTVAFQSDAELAPSLSARLRLRDDDSWRIHDIEIDGSRLSSHYRHQFSATIDGRYSPAVLEAELLRRDYIVIEDFTASGDDQLPLGWRWRDRDEDRHKPYRVRNRDGETYLAAQDSGGSVLLLRFAHWNPRQFPIMTWCWRADHVPPGGDERFGHTNDSAAGIYVFFSQTWIGMPRHIKFVWSSTLSEGFIGRRDRIARPYFVVVESGEEQLGEWLFAAVDLEEHYDRTWGGRPKKRTEGLGLLTDANSTDSRAEAYYADMRVWTREAFEAGRVQDHCSCYRELTPAKKADSGLGTTSSPLRLGITP
jgi:hypothetical protein